MTTRTLTDGWRTATPIPVVAYLRVSDPRQVESGSSLEAQQQAVSSFASREGLAIVATFEDEGKSAATFDRAGYEEMKVYLRSHPEVKGVVVDNFDRFSRGDLAPALTEIDILRHSFGLTLYFADGTLALGPDEFLAERFDIPMKAMMAAGENIRKSRRIVQANKVRTAQGHWVNQPPFGYRTVPCDSSELPADFRCCGKGRKLTPDDKAPIIAEIARLFDAGKPRSEIRAWLRQEHSMAVDNNWLRRQLTNPACAGDVYWGRRGKGKYQKHGERSSDDVAVAKDAHPAIVARGMFARIQRCFSRPYRGHPRADGQPLDGLVFCACGARAYRVSNQKEGGRRHHYYICAARHRFNTCDLSARLPIQAIADVVEAQFGAEFPHGAAEELGHSLGARFAGLVIPELDRLLKGGATVRKRLKAEVEKLTHQQDTIYDDRLVGRVPPDVAMRKLEKLTTDIATVKGELAGLKEDFNINPDEWVKGLMADYGKFFEREFTRLFVARITVTGKDVTVTWTDFAQSVKVKDGSPAACS